MITKFTTRKEQIDRLNGSLLNALGTRNCLAVCSLDGYGSRRGNNFKTIMRTLEKHTFEEE